MFCTTRISLTYFRLQTESIRQNFDVIQQGKYIKAHGATGLVQKLQAIMGYSRQSSSDIAIPSQIRPISEPPQAPTSTDGRPTTVSELNITPIPTPVDMESQNMAITQDQSPRRDLLARKLNQIRDSSGSPVEVCTPSNLVVFNPVLYLRSVRIPLPTLPWEYLDTAPAVRGYIY